MNSSGYLLLGYSIALGLLWGYAALLWAQRRALRRRADA